MVFFCPDCNYTLGISKSLKFDKSDDDQQNIENVTEALKLSKNNKINDYKATFLKKDLLKNKKYQKLSQEEKNNLDQLFINKVFEADLNCSNCGFRKQIGETIKLYEFNVNDTTNSIKTLEDNKLLCFDPTMPRTRDFTCKNVNCVSHKDPKNKEAVFTRIQKSYNLSYICCTCYYSWNLV
tara:strand:+ start:349 stop:891 length:543 start_codon:yes stop_codon:yes gene_type:complete